MRSDSETNPRLPNTISSGALPEEGRIRGHRLPISVLASLVQFNARGARDFMKVLVLDIGGTHVKALASGIKVARQFDSGPELTPKSMVPPVRANSSAEHPPTRALADAARAHIAAILNETNWVIGGPRGAAVQLGLPRTILISRMRRLGISNGTSGQRAGRLDRSSVTVTGTDSNFVPSAPEATALTIFHPL
jgi:hypothetical protein